MTGSRVEQDRADVVDDVRDAICAIPRGSVATYGDIGARAGLGPRQVGRLMGVLGDGVPWWRVVRADGAAATCHDGTAWERLRAEGVAMRGSKVDLVTTRVGYEFFVE
jgi:alkylated DNA nucleotide flippase Atl1